MTKDAKPQQSGDSAELQALFDSFAAQVPSLDAGAVLGEAGGDIDESGDSDELQALFDAVAGQRDEEQQAVAQSSPGAGTPMHASFDATLFARLGRATRQLHDALSALADRAEGTGQVELAGGFATGLSEQLRSASQASAPLQQRLQEQSAQLRMRWEDVFAGKASTDQFRVLSTETRDFLGEVEVASAATGARLGEIGQVADHGEGSWQAIRGVLEVAGELEQELAEILLAACPDARNGAAGAGQGNESEAGERARISKVLERFGF